MLDYFLILIISYLLGNIQTSYIIGRIIKKTDIREHGSGNAGTTNALRVFGKKFAIVTLLADSLKGVLAVLIGERMLGLDGALLAGLAVIIGHNWPFYLKFKGGKGVATSIGVGIAVSPITALISLLIGVGVIVKTRYVSLGSLTGIVLWPIVNFIINGSSQVDSLKRLIFGILLATMSIYKHRENIKRLMSGNENKLGQNKR